MKALRHFKNKKGQAMVEYVLMLAMVALVSIGFTRFIIKDLFSSGLNELPENARPYLEHKAPGGGI